MHDHGQRAEGPPFLYVILATPAASAGLVGNVLSLAVFATKEFRRRSFTPLLTTLAVADTTFLLFNICRMNFGTFNEMVDPSLFYGGISYFENVGLTASICLTMVICLERYLVTCKPMFARSNTVMSAMILVVAFSVIKNLPRFGTISVAYVPYVEAELGRCGLPVVLENWSNLPVLAVLPLLVLPVLSCLIALAVRRSARFRSAAAAGAAAPVSNKATIMPMTVVLVFMACHGTRIVLDLVALGQELGRVAGSYRYVIAYYASSFLLVVNSSCNLIIYAGRDAKFRKALAALFRWKPAASLLTRADKNKEKAAMDRAALKSDTQPMVLSTSSAAVN